MGHGGAAEHGGLRNRPACRPEWGEAGEQSVPGIWSQISEAAFPGQGGWSVWSPKELGGGRAQAPPRASVTRLLLRTLGAPLHLESPGPFVSWKQTL